MTSSRAALRRRSAGLRWGRVWENSPYSLDPVTPSKPEVTLRNPAAENRAKTWSKAVQGVSQRHLDFPEWLERPSSHHSQA